jgi:hypothetical protein
MSPSAISRIWRAFGLKPHLVDTFKLSTDPQFLDKVRDVVGLYLNPPQAALVVSVDEKSSIQALDRTAPILPLPGTPQRQAHDDTRHGTTNLDAALDVASGKVISQMTPRHRAVEFKRFLAHGDRAVPAELALHVIWDNSSTHKTRGSAVAGGPSAGAAARHPDRQLLAEPGRAVVRRADEHVAAPREPPQCPGAGPVDPPMGGSLERASAAVRVDQDRRRDPRHDRHLLPANQPLRTLGALWCSRFHRAVLFAAAVQRLAGPVVWWTEHASPGLHQFNRSLVCV